MHPCVPGKRIWVKDAVAIGPWAIEGITVELPDFGRWTEDWRGDTVRLDCVRSCAEDDDATRVQTLLAMWEPGTGFHDEDGRTYWSPFRATFQRSVGLRRLVPAAAAFGLVALVAVVVLTGGGRSTDIAVAPATPEGGATQPSGQQETAAGLTGLAVQVAVGGTATARFVAPGDGLPLAGISVVVEDEAGEAVAQGVTDVDGTSQMALEPGTYRVSWMPRDSYIAPEPGCVDRMAEVANNKVTAIRFLVFDESEGPNNFGNPAANPDGFNFGCPRYEDPVARPPSDE